MNVYVDIYATIGVCVDVDMNMDEYVYVGVSVYIDVYVDVYVDVYDGVAVYVSKHPPRQIREHHYYTLMKTKTYTANAYTRPHRDVSYAHVCVHMCVCIRMCVCVYMCAFMCVHVGVCACVCVYTLFFLCYCYVLPTYNKHTTKRRPLFFFYDYVLPSTFTHAHISTLPSI